MVHFIKIVTSVSSSIFFILFLAFSIKLKSPLYLDNGKKIVYDEYHAYAPHTTANSVIKRCQRDSEFVSSMNGQEKLESLSNNMSDSKPIPYASIQLQQGCNHLHLGGMTSPRAFNKKFR